MQASLIRNRLESTLVDINRQIAAVIDIARKQGVEPEQIMSADGHHLMTPLLLARAQALNGLAVLHDKKG